MKTIFKYPVMAGHNKIDLPYRAEFLNFGTDGSDRICMWFLVDKDEVIYQPKVFVVVGTGWPLEDDNFFEGNYLGTALQSDFVWHLFRM